MMMIAPNSLVRQEEGAEGEEKEAVGRRKGGPTGTPTPSADASPGPTWSGASDTKNMRKHGRCCGVAAHRRGSGG